MNGFYLYRWMQYIQPKSKKGMELVQVAILVAIAVALGLIFKTRATSGGSDIIKVPGTYAYFGTGNPVKEGTTAAHHDSKFDIDEDALIQSVSLYTFYAIDFLNQE